MRYNSAFAPVYLAPGSKPVKYETYETYIVTQWLGIRKSGPESRRRSGSPLKLCAF